MTAGLVRRSHRPTIDRETWRLERIGERPLLRVLRERDITTIFDFLRRRGWSRAAIAGATGLSENRVRAIARGRQAVTSYDVLERIADGLNIDRGWMGLGYTDE
jgi:ribosome-binding protein aMBF1 (putative translation factor)